MMKLNFTIDEWKEWLESGESDKVFFETLKDLGLDIEEDFKKESEVKSNGSKF